MHQEPRYTVRSGVPRIPQPDHPTVPCGHSAAFAGQSQDDQVSMGSSQHYDLFFGEHTGSQNTRLAHRPIVDESSPQGVPSQTQTVTLANQIARDTFGMDGHSVCGAGPYLEEGESSNGQWSNTAQLVVDECVPNRVVAQYHMPEIYIDPGLIEADISHGMQLEDTGPATDAIGSPGYDNLAFVTATNMRSLPPQLHLRATALENSVGDDGLQSPLYHPLLDDFFWDPPWVPPAMIPSIYGDHGLERPVLSPESTLNSNPGYDRPSSSAFEPTMSSETSPHSNFDPISVHANRVRQRPKGSRRNARVGDVPHEQFNSLGVHDNPKYRRRSEATRHLYAPSLVDVASGRHESTFMNR